MNMEMARQGLNKYYQKAMAQNILDPSVMKECLEPVFRQAGYREPVKAGTPARILVIRDDAAGDFILFSPFLRELRRIYQGAEITLLASSRNINLAQCCPYVDHIIMNGALGEYPNRLMALRGCLNVAISLLEYNFDLAFSPRLGINSFSTLLGYICGATQVVAFTNDRYSPVKGKVVETGWDCLMAVAVPADNLPKNDVDTNLFMLEYMLRAPLLHRQLELWMTQADKDKAEELLHAPYPLATAARQGKRGKKAHKTKLPAGPWADRFTYLIGVMPGASLGMKQWPVERYAEVLQHILKANPQMGVVVMGGPDDTKVGRKLQKALGDRAICLAGKCSYRESAAVMSHLNMYIGNDTGLLHIAVACRLPILSVNCFPASLGLARMSIPVRFAPYMVPSVTCMPAKAADKCRNAFSYGCQEDDKPHCILGVTVELVLKGYRALLQRIAEGNIEPMYLCEG